MAVIFYETSNPTKRVIAEPPTVRITGRDARIAALSADQAPTAIIGCPHMTMPVPERFVGLTFKFAPQPLNPCANLESLC
jgi:hypothetical protein